MRKESQTEEKEREQINEMKMKVEEGKSHTRQKVLIRHAQ